MNFSLLSILAVSLSSVDALNLLGFCAGPGMIKFSNRHRYHLNFLPPRFRKFARIQQAQEHEDSHVLHDAENVFHLIKSLPNDCFTYVNKRPPGKGNF